MRKFLLAAVTAACCFLSVSYAQHEKSCYTTEVYRQRIHDHPEILQVQQTLEQFTTRFNAGRTSVNRVAGQLYIIPVVFHIIHNYGPENISDAQVLDQVRILNDDFRKRSFDTASIVPPFKTIAADCEIEFRLANIDPNGNCTNGIDRIASMRTYHADDASKLNPWPENNYLNIWVVASLDWTGVAAYAYYPGTAPPGADGIISLSNYIGSIGQGSLSYSRVITHEVGHCLNLQHPWGDTNDPVVSCGDDLVFDTPVTMGWTQCSPFGSTCGNVIDNVQNYMEYSYCCRMFTEGQKARMIAALNAPVGGRNNLWTGTNLIATGVDGSTVQLCVPITDFKADSRMGCPGSTMKFRDLSWNGQPTSWSWRFPGGDPDSSLDSVPPLIHYELPGVYPVTLVTGNASGSDSITKSGYIIIPDTSGQTSVYSESFETPGSFPGTDEYIVNPYGGNTWMHVSNAGSTGTSSIMINNFSGNTSAETDDYITPAFDFTNVVRPRLDFKVAYAMRDSNHFDMLDVHVSLDCGKTWTIRYAQGGLQLATAGIDTGYFVPSALQWRQEFVSIQMYHNQPDVRFRFRNTSGTGNNLYIDDINVNGLTTGMKENSLLENPFLIFPNPASGKFSVSFQLDKNSRVVLKVTDAMGRDVSTMANALMTAGEYKIPFDQCLAAGIYFIILECNGERFTEKVLITE